MYKYLGRYFISLLFLALPVWSQSYTIEQLVTQVKDRSDDIEISEIEYKATGEDVKMSRAEAFPQINLSTGVGYAGTSREPQKYASPPPSVKNNPMGYLTHLHGTTLNWGVTLSQPLITFGKVKSALAIADIYKEQRNDSRSIKKEGYYASVVQAFTTAYTAQQDVAIAEQTVAHDERYLEKIRVEFDLGTALPRDTLNVLAKLSASKSALIRAKVKLRTDLRKLSVLTEVPMDESTALEYDPTGWLSEITTQSDKEKSLELLLKESEVAMREEQIQYERSKLFPAIYLNAKLDNSYMIPNVSQAKRDIKNSDGFKESPNTLTFRTNSEPPKDSMISKDLHINNYMDTIAEKIPGIDKLFSPDYVNYSIGLQLTWNIYDGNRMRSNARKTRYLHDKARVELKKLEDEKSIVIAESQDIYKAIEESKVAATIQRDALKRAFESISDDYDDGYAEFLTFSDMERNIAAAEKQIYALNMQKILAVTQHRIASGISIVKETK